ncbi:MAG: hypothetical protein RIK87_17170 [Fuerstiella sp.]
MMTDRDELMIQKCVDNELAADERRQLMERLDQINDGWKTLACAYLEDQLLAGAVCADSRPRVATTVTDTSAQKRQAWFHHPLTSLALAACVAFLSGVIISGQLPNRSPSDGGPSAMAVAESGEQSSGATSSQSPDVPSETSSAPRLLSDGNVYRVRLEADGMPTSELPVYSPGDYRLRSENFWRQLSNSLANGIRERRTPDIRVFLFHDSEGRTYVIPAGEFSRTPSLQ